jgi:pimeloyl-ACP methyl ester carboxylesterase
VSTFVLVHGAWHGSWCWKRVRRELQRRGHDVFTPTLTGLADRSHLLTPEVTLETHILDVVNLIEWEELDQVVLCGHSYAGAVVAGVADRLPQRIRSLVYLDAFIPENGQGLSKNVPAERVQDGWKVHPIAAEKFCVNAADQAWVDRQCTPQSIDCWLQPSRLNGDHARIATILYVLATGWGGGQPPFHPHYSKALERGWKTIEVSCGHDVMLDEPTLLADILVEASADPS